MTEPAATTTISESMSATEIGALMAALRVQFKLTPQDVSERLHIRARYVNAMEKGDMKQMPGIVYARGYVHTYAEFLGLNPAQAVQQCFAGELPAVSATKLHKPSTLETTRSMNWRGMSVIAAAVIGCMALVQALSGEDDASQELAATVAPPPAALLGTLGGGVMPTPQNFGCLNSNSMLGCFFADSWVQQSLRFSSSVSLPFVGALLLPAPLEPVLEMAVEPAAEPAIDSDADSLDE